MAIIERSTFENKTFGQSGLSQTARYRIRIQGDLPVSWSDRLLGMKISIQNQKDGPVITSLTGLFKDQAALIGVLVALNNLHLPLISVECLEPARKEVQNLIVNAEQKGAFIEFVVTGTYDLQSAIDQFPLVIAACRQMNISKALIDYRDLAGEILETQEVLYAFQVGEYYQEHLSSGGQPLKIAFVGKDIIPQSAGAEIARVFNLKTILTRNYQAAVDWLCDEV